MGVGIERSRQLTTQGTVSSMRNNQTIVTDFEETTWSLGSGGSYDTTNFVSGLQALKLTAPAGTTRTASLVKSANLYGKNLSIELYATDLTNVSDIVLSFSLGDTSFTKFAMAGLYPYAFQSGWNHISIAPPALRFYGGATQVDMANVMIIQVALYAGTGGQAQVTVDRLCCYDSVATNGSILFTFDDVLSNIYSNAKPVLDKYGYPATVWVITDGVGTGEYMTLAQLKTLRDQGWMVGSHTRTHAHLAQVDASTLNTELSVSQQWLLSNGFSPGHRYIAFPYGEFNNNVLEATRTYYAMGFSTETRYMPGFAVNQFRTPRIQFSASQPPGFGTVADVKAALDNVKANKYTLLLFCHSIPGDWTVSEFGEIVDYVAALGLDVLTVDDLARIYGW